MDTLHLFIAVTLALITTAQGVSSCTNGDVELIQDPADTRIVGYVQYCFSGEWRRVCRESGYMTLWDDSEAVVACRQLGYTSTGYAYVSHDNTWTGGFVAVNCINGSESSLEDCHPGRVITSRENTCTSGNHARLLCEPADCINGTPRLVGGSTDREGRVEVCVGGRWGTVQTNQSLEVAETVCISQSQIVDFYSTLSSYVSKFGYSLSKPVYNCSSNTSGGLECLNSTTPDDHTRDLGVSCEQNVMMCSDHQSGQFRLVDGKSHNEGRLEVCVGGQWRGVCTTSLSNTTAGEICTRLGFSGNDSEIMSFEPTGRDIYCCNAELHCTQCNNSCNDTTSDSLPCTTVTLEQGTTASTLITETTTAQQNQSTTAARITETTTAQHNQSTTAESPGDGRFVTAVIVVLVLAMATGCIITCTVVVWKRTRARKNYSIEMSCEPGAAIATTANENYSFLPVQDEHLYSEATPVTHNYSTAGPGYEYATINELVIDNYDVIGSNQPMLNEAQAANPPPPVRDEAIENQDDFHNAEQHLYTDVNKKAKKRSPPDESPYDKTFAKEKDTTAMLEGGES